MYLIQLMVNTAYFCDEVRYEEGNTPSFYIVVFQSFKDYNVVFVLTDRVDTFVGAYQYNLKYVRAYFKTNTYYFIAVHKTKF